MVRKRTETITNLLILGMIVRNQWLGQHFILLNSVPFIWSSFYKMHLACDCGFWCLKENLIHILLCKKLIILTCLDIDLPHLHKDDLTISHVGDNENIWPHWNLAASREKYLVAFLSLSRLCPFSHHAHVCKRLSAILACCCVADSYSWSHFASAPPARYPAIFLKEYLENNLQCARMRAY